MKKPNIMKTIAFVFLITCAPLWGQQDSIPRKNIIKTNLTGFIFRNYQLTYERALNKTFSVNITYAKMPEGGLPIVKNYLDSDDNFSQTQISNQSFTLETRIYLGKGWGKGFYIAPYYRNSKLEIKELVYDFDETLNEVTGQYYENIPVTFSGSIKSNNFGLLIGTQWLLGKKQNWVIDFWILGAHYGKAKGNLNGALKNISLSPHQQELLQQELIDLDIPILEYSVKTHANGAIADIDSPWLGLRSGLSFGFRF